MNEQTVSKFVTGSVALSTFLVMLLGVAYVYVCFNFSAPEMKVLAIPAGSIITLFLSYHLGKTYTIFKQKKVVERAEYMLSYPLFSSVIGFFIALLFIGASGISSEAKTITIATLLLFSIFNLYVSIRLLKQM